jgi:hypothetical protein
VGFVVGKADLCPQQVDRLHIVAESDKKGTRQRNLLESASHSFVETPRVLQRMRTLAQAATSKKPLLLFHYYEVARRGVSISFVPQR